MKQTSVIKKILVALFLSASTAVFSQSIAINSSGNPGNAAAILDLSDASNGSLGFLLTNVSLLAYNSSSPINNPPDGLIVYNTNASMVGGLGKGFYYWSAAASKWCYLLNSGNNSNGSTLANNGLNISVTGDTVQLGATLHSGNALEHNTYIYQARSSAVGFGLIYDFGTVNGTINTSGSYFAIQNTAANPYLSVINGGNTGIGIAQPVSTLDVNGSFGIGTIDLAPAASTNTNITGAYSTIVATPPAAAATYTLNLPSATANPRQIYTIIYNGGNSGTIDITATAGNMVLNGNTVTSPFTLTGGSVTFRSDGANWNASSVWTGNHGAVSFYYTGISATTSASVAINPQSWVVPAGITTVTVTIAGAAGGPSAYYALAPAPGAVLSGTLTVIPGHALDMLIGGAGLPRIYSGGGGGASYLWDASNTTLPLAVAGGGGGENGVSASDPAATPATATIASAAALETASNGAGTAPGAAGTGGNGGTYGGTADGGGGGAGWLTSGGSATAHTGTSTAYYPLSAIYPGLGGYSAGSSGSGAGGFGGGGGSGEGGDGGGGGGGYNGGGGGGTTGGGGGGGGYWQGTVPTSASATSYGNGFVIIQW